MQLNTIQAYDIVNRNARYSRKEAVTTKETFKSALKETISQRPDKTKTGDSFDNNAAADLKEVSIEEIEDLAKDLEKSDITSEDILKLINLMGIDVFIENESKNSFNTDSTEKAAKVALDLLKGLGENTVSLSNSNNNEISKILNEFITVDKGTSEININEIIHRLDSLAMAGKVKEVNMEEKSIGTGENRSSEVISMELNKAHIKSQEDKNVVLMKGVNISNESASTIQVADAEANSKENLSQGNKESFAQPKGDHQRKEVGLQIETKEERVLNSIANSESKAGSFSLNFNRLAQASDIKEKLIEPKISQSTIANDVVKVIKHMNTNHMKELTVKITPENLGEITIKVTSEGGVFKAVISASSKDTYSLLNANASEIRNGLNNTPIKVQEVAINIYNEDTTFFSDSFNNKGEFQGNEHNRSSNHKKTSEEDGLAVGDKGNENLYLDGNLSVLA